MNVWSGGNYSHNTSGISSASDGLVTVSSDWASKGDESFLWEASTSQIKDLVRVSTDILEAGTWTLTMDVLNLSSAFVISFFSSTENQVRVTVPASNNVTNIELSITLTTEEFLSCRIVTSDAAKFLCDNVSIVNQ